MKRFLDFFTGRQMALPPEELAKIQEEQWLATEYYLSTIRPRREGSTGRRNLGGGTSARNERRKGNAEERLRSTYAERGGVARAISSPSFAIADSVTCDLRSALENLGMPRPEALEVAKRLKVDYPAAGFDELLRKALKAAPLNSRTRNSEQSRS